VPTSARLLLSVSCTAADDDSLVAAGVVVRCGKRFCGRCLRRRSPEEAAADVVAVPRITESCYFAEGVVVRLDELEAFPSRFESLDASFER